MRQNCQDHPGPSVTDGTPTTRARSGPGRRGQDPLACAQGAPRKTIRPDGTDVPPGRECEVGVMARRTWPWVASLVRVRGLAVSHGAAGCPACVSSEMRSRMPKRLRPCRGLGSHPSVLSIEASCRATRTTPDGRVRCARSPLPRSRHPTHSPDQTSAKASADRRLRPETRALKPPRDASASVLPRKTCRNGRDLRDCPHRVPDTRARSESPSTPRDAVHRDHSPSTT